MLRPWPRARAGRVLLLSISCFCCERPGRDFGCGADCPQITQEMSCCNYRLSLLLIFAWLRAAVWTLALISCDVPGLFLLSLSARVLFLPGWAAPCTRPRNRESCRHTSNIAGQRKHHSYTSGTVLFDFQRSGEAPRWAHHCVLIWCGCGVVTACSMHGYRVRCMLPKQ